MAPGEQVETAIVGGGVAGSTAALFSARLGRSTLAFNSGLPGGQLLNISKIEDFPGFSEGVVGFELCPAIQEQALDAGARFEMYDVTSLKETGGSWLLDTVGGQFEARSVIIATGGTPRSLGVPGEERFHGLGVSHCASCDGPLFRDKVVAVVGGGDSALQEALELTEHVDRVVLIHRGEELGGQEAYRRRVETSDRIEVRLGATIVELLGDATLTGVRVAEPGSTTDLEVSGLFVYIGNMANSSLLDGVATLDHRGQIETDLWMRTERPGLLAAGEVRSESAAQAVSVAGDGATAAIAAHRYMASGVWRD